MFGIWTGACGGPPAPVARAPIAPAPAAPAPVASAPPPPASPAPDTYEGLIVRAEAGEPVDFRRLRMAYLESPGFQRGDDVTTTLEPLRQQLHDAMRAHQNEAVLAAAEQILKLHYIDLEAQTMRGKACKLLARDHCERYEAVALGLLRSVVAGRDGKTCATGWTVVTVPEEYFVMRVAGLRPTMQGLSGMCDVIDTVDEHGAKRTLYFDIDAMMTAAVRRHGP